MKIKNFIYTLVVLGLTLNLMTAPVSAGVTNATHEVTKASSKLPRSTPEQEGISSLNIIDMLNDFEKQGIEVHSVLVARNGKVVFESYYKPYNPDTTYIVHSLTKLFTNTAAGIAYSQGKFKLDDKVISFFPERVPKDAGDNLKAMTIKDLITMRNGHARMISGNEWRPLKSSWLDAFFKEPVVYKPGTKFQYSSGNAYVVSAIAQKTMGKTCDLILKDALFNKMGIEGLTWDKSPEGICSGGNGVMIKPEDMLKFGQLYLQMGAWNGEQLISRDWVERSLGLKDTYNDGQRKYAYHWDNRVSGIYDAGGAFGQTLMIDPDLNLAVAVMAGTNKSKELYNVVKEDLIDRTLSGKNLAGSGKYTNILKDKGDNANLLPMVRYTTSPLEGKISGKSFTINENKDNIAKIKLDFTKDSVIYTMTDNRGTHKVKCGLGNWLSGDTTMTGNYLHHQYQNPIQKIVAAANWDDNNTLSMIWRYPEMAFWDKLKIKLTDSTISMVRSVNVNSQGTVRPEVKGQIK